MRSDVPGAAPTSNSYHIRPESRSECATFRPPEGAYLPRNRTPIWRMWPKLDVAGLERDARPLQPLVGIRFAPNHANSGRIRSM